MSIAIKNSTFVAAIRLAEEAPSNDRLVKILQASMMADDVTVIPAEAELHDQLVYCADVNAFKFARNLADNFGHNIGSAMFVGLAAFAQRLQPTAVAA
jgi:GGDEF domain-containing protein